MPACSATSPSPFVPDLTARPVSGATRTWALAETDLFAVIRFRGLPIRCLLLRASETSSPRRRRKRAHGLILGASSRAHAPADIALLGDGATGDWDVLAPDGGGFRLSVPATAELWWSAHETARVQAMDMDTVPPILRLGEEGRLTLSLGDIAVDLRRAERASAWRIAPAGFFGPLDLQELTGHGASALLVLAWLAVFRFMPPEGEALSFDLESRPPERRPCLVIPALLSPVPAASEQSDLGAAEGPSAAASASSERAHRPGPSTAAFTRARSGPKTAEAAAEDVRNIGLLKALNANPSAWARATHGDALDEDAVAVLGDLRGVALAGAFSAGGFGAPGSGSGAAGTGEGLAGRGGGLLEIPGGVRDGRRPSLGPKELAWDRKRDAVPEVIPGESHVQGSLDKEIIRRIIRRHINEVRYCYQQSLQRRPSLGGRVVLSFLILPQGTTTAVTPANDTVGDPSLATCLVQAGRRWIYPAPQDGRVVKVSFPFVFTPVGFTE